MIMNLYTVHSHLKFLSLLKFKKTRLDLEWGILDLNITKKNIF
jgi:hypothetical protein